MYRTWRDVYANPPAGVLVSRNVLLEKRILWVKLTIVSITAAALIEGHLVVFEGEASWPVRQYVRLADAGSQAAVDKLKAKLGIG